MESTYSLVWWMSLSIISFLNVLFIYNKADAGQSLSEVKLPSNFLQMLWNNRRYLMRIYVIVCAFRSILPRMDGDRVCFWDLSFISTVAVGRSLATVAEISYCMLVSLWIVRMTGNAMHFHFWTSLNVIAQSCCWYSVLTTNQLGHIMEESIWTFTAAHMLLCAYYYHQNAYWVDLPEDARDEEEQRERLVNFAACFILIAFAYIVFMVRTDVPMYYNRYTVEEAANKSYLSFENGFQEVQSCKNVTQRDAYWIAEMPWKTGYFTFGVWSSIYLGL